MNGAHNGLSIGHIARRSPGVEIWPHRPDRQPQGSALFQLRNLVSIDVVEVFKVCTLPGSGSFSVLRTAATCGKHTDGSSCRSYAQQRPASQCMRNERCWGFADAHDVFPYVYVPCDGLGVSEALR